MQKIYIIVYLDTLLIFKYLCNRVNIQANRIFVSALLITLCYLGQRSKISVQETKKIDKQTKIYILQKET